jgi:hypothetical protein
MKKCPQCNRTYADESFSFCLEDGALLSASYDPDATLVIPAPINSTSKNSVEQLPIGVDVNRKFLPIELVPSDPVTFKQQLLRSRVAEIVTTYSDGTAKTKIWKATNFSASSNVIGNLRSRPDFRAGQWQAKGIAKVTVRVIDNP